MQILKYMNLYKKLKKQLNNWMEQAIFEKLIHPVITKKVFTCYEDLTFISAFTIDIILPLF
jgi:hypothetical protein